MSKQQSLGDDLLKINSGEVNWDVKLQVTQQQTTIGSWQMHCYAIMENRDNTSIEGANVDSGDIQLIMPDDKLSLALFFILI